MKTGGFSLLRIRGIEIIVDYSWFILFFLVVYTMAEGYFPQTHQNYSKPQYWGMGILTAFLFFVSILIHELAHCFVALKHGIKVIGIRLLIFGGLSQVANEPKNGRQEFLIALAGPASSMLLGMGFFAVYLYLRITNQMIAASGIAGSLAFGNIVLAVFNMIPGFPLDGGRILRAFLWDHWDDAARATRVVSQLGSAFALFLIIFGILQFVAARSIISGLWFIFIGLFMKQSATGSFQGFMLRRTLAGVQVRQVMTRNLVTVDWLISVDQLVHDFIYKHHFTNFPVFNRDEFLGMVSLEDVKRISKDLWNFKQARDIMTPIELIACLKPDDDAADAFSTMISKGINLMPVVEEDHLMGIVFRSDLMNLFKIKSDLGST